MSAFFKNIFLFITILCDRNGRPKEKRKNKKRDN